MSGASAVASGGSAHTRLVQEPCLQVAIGLEQACEAGCHHRDIGLAHSARRHALVPRVDEDGDTARLQCLLNAVGDLRGQCLLRLQALRETVANTRQLRMPTTRWSGM